MATERFAQFDEDRPETFPVYSVSVRLPTAGGKDTVFLGLKCTGLDVVFEDGRAAHYDLEGRLLRVAAPPNQWRRGLSHRAVFTQRRAADHGTVFHTRLMVDTEIDSLLDDTSRRLRSALDTATDFPAGVWTEKSAPSDGRTSLEHLALRAAGFDASAARRDLAAFQSLYHDVPILPPDQYTALALMATDGCPYNQCSFCGFYRTAPFRRKSPAEFGEHIARAVAYHGHGLAARNHIFLGQANALIGEHAWREAMFRVVGEHFELPAADKQQVEANWWLGSLRRFSGITSFLDAFSGMRIHSDEFAALRALNLRRIFIGMETGDDALLRWLRKPGSPERVVDTVRAARAGGVHVGVIVLVGAGGERFFDQHIRHTVARIHDMGLRRGDYVYLSPLVDMDSSEYATLAARDGIEPLTVERMREQEQQLRAGLATSPRRGGPYIARYEVSHFLY